MDVRYLPTPEQTKQLTTTGIREHFLLGDLFVPGSIRLVYSHVDRMIIGGIVPTEKPLRLDTGKELASDYFAERREIGVFAMSDGGLLKVDGVDFPTSKYDMVYIGRGSQEIEFSSPNSGSAAQFYMVSLPAHTTYPTTHIKQSEATRLPLGRAETSNERVIYQYIHNQGVQSCQLVMGYTAMKPASVWNTMPPHLHDRRSEVYMYFDLSDDAVVFHLMGQPQETRHIVMRAGDAIISPGWSIHAGVGTQSYGFVWAMGGENQEFSDMDAVSLEEIV